MDVAVVTDSTACLTAGRAGELGVTVVPLHVTVSGRGTVGAREITPGEVADLLGRGRQTVSTSRPSPGELADCYRELVGRTGVREIVSVHLSADVSGTVEAARLAAAEVADEVAVTVVDSRVLALALGYAVTAAARAAAGGASAASVAEVAGAVAAGSRTWFYVDTLEHLRRGGRIGTAAALVGSALAIKPLLTIRGGEVALAERVRTRGRALGRLVDLVVEAVDGAGGAGEDGWENGREGGREVRLAVHHLAAEDGARELAARLAERTGVQAEVVELDPVVSVHTGPGTLGVVVAAV